ncbi:hypothetical protein C5L38_34375 (plasmid) [Streptomyces sp. WAC00288]|uniref:hypothetical protein n=1 Tax=unclassified Streptomyces TaxID=2593676 RepID=UPI000789739A|nr:MULTISPECIES: hypothetical protein [unclassified Streptomyces]AVI00143.1 hypothetical protein C5L38_34375 [Streptomyces sp. WAC00288]KYG51203.1 hypothetical protein AWI43_32775 [Streptomyces sp. WAC04657]
MQVDLPQDVRGTAARLGSGVPYALEVLVSQLTDEPDIGSSSNLPGILTMTVDGGPFEDCPDLIVGYIREPDRVEIRYVNAVPSPIALPEEQDQGTPSGSIDPDPSVTDREVTDAWQLITRWLEHNAPASHAALRTGASSVCLADLKDQLSTHIPGELVTLWGLTAGDDGVDGRGCLPGNKALMPLEAVADVYRMKTEAQARQYRLDAGSPVEEQVIVWKESWIPVMALAVADRTSGLYLDAATGYLGRWSRYNEGPDDWHDTLGTYLEEMADMLENPALATRDKPGLVDRALVWLSGLDPAQETRWQPLAS